MNSFARANYENRDHIALDCQKLEPPSGGICSPVGGGRRPLPPLFHLSMLSLSLWLFLIAAFSPLAAWRYELPGSIISLLAFAAFYLIIFPRGWLFPSFTLAPLLFLLAQALSRLGK